MTSILIAGAGIIGRSVAQWLHHCQDYQVHLVDIKQPSASIASGITFTIMDITHPSHLEDYVKANEIHAIVSTLPYFCNIHLAEFAKQHGLHYFDPTEDIQVTQTIADMADTGGIALVPQCGLAPGYINIIANHYIKDFDHVEKVKLRCGALPQHTSNALLYAFSWSPDGLINEYINPCQILEKKKLTQVAALEGLEHIEIDGNTYEAFHTSGGLATLAQIYQNKIDHMDYKTVRYPGHAEKMKFLLKDMKLSEDRNTLQKMMMNAIPYTNQDIVLVYVSVNGTRNERYEKRSFAHKYYPQNVFGMECSAIQLTTTAGICAIIDIVLNHPEKHHGFIHQAQFSLEDFYSNRFGQTLKPKT